MDEYLDIGNCVLSPLSDPVSSSGCSFKRIIIWWLIVKTLARYLTKSRPVTEIPFVCHPHPAVSSPSMCASCTNTEGLISRLNETRENRRMNASPLFPTKLRAARMWGYRRLVALGKSVFLSVWDELVKLQQNRWQGQMLRMVLKVRQMTRDWGQRAVLEFWCETE